VRIDHRERFIVVGPAPRGRKPTWGGFIPALLGFELCQRMRDVLGGTDEYSYLDSLAARALRERRESMRDLLRRGLAIQVEEGSASWWTFAGGRVNYTVKYGLELLGGWKVVADNFHLRVEGDGVSDSALRARMADLADEDFWWDTETRRTILGRVPEYRLSKFQAALPDAFAVEVVGAYLLDFDRTAEWLMANRPQ